MMNGRVFDPEQDLPMIQEWAKAIPAWVPPKEMLPPTGVVIMDGEIPCACGFLYMDVFTPVGSINWFFVNPGIDAFRKDESVHAAFAYLSMISVDENRPVVLFYGKGGMARIARKHGFNLADDGISLNVKPITSKDGVR